VQAATLAAVVSKDKRAVTVRVDDVVGVAGFLLPAIASMWWLPVRMSTAEPSCYHGNWNNIKVLAVDQTAAANSNEPVVGTRVHPRSDT